MLHWHLRKALKAMHEQDGTLEVLIALICHSNVRWRCWVGMDYLSDETGCAIAVVTAAKKWLLTHGAIYLVPYSRRIGKELDLPPRQHVYQLTGILQINGASSRYLNLNDEAWHEIQEEVSQYSASYLNVSPHEISPHEVSSHETKGISSLQDDSTPQDHLTDHSNGHTIQSDNSNTPPKNSAPPPQRRRKKVDVPPPGDGVLDAICKLCYGTLDAWQTNASSIRGCYNRIAEAELKRGGVVTLDSLRTFYSWWYRVDWRGKKGQKPEPHQVAQAWPVVMAADANEDRELLSTDREEQDRYDDSVWR